jgi:hypothetical protein
MARRLSEASHPVFFLKSRQQSEISFSKNASPLAREEVEEEEAEAEGGEEEGWTSVK